MQDDKAKPLSHIRVLDLSRVLAGPWSTQLLADFGADVIKVERPETGDDTRGWGPPFISLAPGQRTAAYFCSANRGKKSVALDMANDIDRSILIDLVRQADVLVENFKTGSLARYGLDYESLCKLNPRLIYCSITGYGKSGPYAQRPAYDAILQGVSGLMSLTGLPDGVPGAGPMRTGMPVSDILTGVYAAYGIMVALWERERSGIGQNIDLSLLDTLVSSMATVAVPYLASGTVPQRQGTAHISVAPSDRFECADGPVLVTAGNDAQFAKLCQVIGAPHLAIDERFNSNEARTAHREKLTVLLQGHFKRHERLPLIETLSQNGVPAGAINDVAQVLNDPQVQHARLVVDYGVGGMDAPLRLLRNPLQFSRTPAHYRKRPPALNEHADELVTGRTGSVYNGAGHD